MSRTAWLALVGSSMGSSRVIATAGVSVPLVALLAARLVSDAPIETCTDASSRGHPTWRLLNREVATAILRLRLRLRLGRRGDLGHRREEGVLRGDLDGGSAASGGAERAMEQLKRARERCEARSGRAVNR